MNGKLLITLIAMCFGSICYASQGRVKALPPRPTSKGERANLEAREALLALKKCEENRVRVLERPIDDTMDTVAIDADQDSEDYFDTGVLDDHDDESLVVIEEDRTKRCAATTSSQRGNPQRSLPNSHHIDRSRAHAYESQAINTEELNDELARLQAPRVPSQGGKSRGSIPPAKNFVRCTDESQAIDTAEIDAEVAALRAPLEPRKAKRLSAKLSFLDHYSSGDVRDVLVGELEDNDDDGLYSHTLQGVDSVSAVQPKAKAGSSRSPKQPIPSPRKDSQPSDRRVKRAGTKKSVSTEKPVIEYPPIFTVSAPQVVKTRTLPVAQTDSDRRFKKAYNMAIPSGMKQWGDVLHDYKCKLLKFLADEQGICSIDLSDPALLTDEKFKGLDEKFLHWLMGKKYDEEAF